MSSDRLRVLCYVIVIIGTLASSAASGDGAMIQHVDDVRTGEIPLDDPSPKQILEHHSLVTKAARLDKKFKQLVFGVLPTSQDEEALQAGYRAAWLYSAKMKAVVADWLRVEKKDEKLELKVDGFNKTFTRRMQGKKVDVISFVRFSRRHFESHDSFKKTFTASNALSALTKTLVDKVAKLKIDGLVFDLPGFEFSDKAMKGPLQTFLKKLVKALKPHQQNENAPHRIGVLLRDDKTLNSFGYSEFVWVTDALGDGGFVIAGQRTSPFADETFPNPSVDEVKSTIGKLCPTSGTKKMKKQYVDRLLTSFDLLGYKTKEFKAERISIPEFNEVLLNANTTADCGPTDAKLSSTWMPSRTEYLFTASQSLLVPRLPDDTTRCRPGDSSPDDAVSIVVPSPKALKLHTAQLGELKQGLALWDLGLGMEYLFEVL